MKCEICNEEIVKGKGRYLTLIGAVCTECNDSSGMKVQMRTIKTKFRRDAGSSGNRLEPEESGKQTQDCPRNPLQQDQETPYQDDGYARPPLKPLHRFRRLSQPRLNPQRGQSGY